MNRMEVTRLENKAEGLRDYPGDYFPAMAVAARAREQWETEHPAEARAANEMINKYGG